MTGYRPALDCIVEAHGQPLPTGYDRWAIKSTRADLTRHAPQVGPLSKVAHCLPCWGMPPFPCPDYASALALLDALDGGTDG